nr:DUF6794 domain-containing protein [uncultured Mucilaginibacter sp.]
MSGRNLIIALFFIQASACISIAQPAPKNLYEVFHFLDNDWSIVRKTHFKNLSESEATASEHFGMGLWIRNTWIRGNRNPPLVKYFHSIRLHNPDDISSLILLSYHRRLNNKPLDIKAQVDEYASYWEKISDCETRATNQAVTVYNKHKAGDRIIIRMHVYTSEDGSKNATVFVCPSVDWEFDPKKDLEITGEITEKYVINSPSNVFFKVRINKANLNNLQIIGKDMVIGNEMNFSLKNLLVD